MAGKGVNGNLIPSNQRSKEEQTRIARMGGIASGKAKQKKRETRELIRELLASPVQLDKKTLAKLERKGVDTDDMTFERAALVSLASRAASGDQFALRFLYDYAQIPDLKAQMEKDRMEAAKEDAAKAEQSRVIIDV